MTANDSEDSKSSRCFLLKDRFDISFPHLTILTSHQRHSFKCLAIAGRGKSKNSLVWNFIKAGISSEEKEKSQIETMANKQTLFRSSIVICAGAEIRPWHLCNHNVVGGSMRLQHFSAIVGASIFLIVIFQNCAKVNVSSVASEAEVVANGAPMCQKMTSPDVQPELLYSWDHKSSVEPDYKQVMAAPMVGDLDGDHIPEIVFVSYLNTDYHTKGVLRVLNGKDGSLKFSVSSDELRPHAVTSPLLVDLDGDGKAEIVYGHYSGKKMIALNYDGTLRWQLDYDFSGTSLTSLGTCYQGFSAADLNGDGKVQILAAGFLVTEDAKRVPHIQKRFADMSCTSFAASLDTKPNSPLQIIDQNGVYDRQGVLQWKFLRSGQASSADLIPEIPGIEIAVVGGGYLSIYNGLTGEVILDKQLSEHSELICSSGSVGGGQATIGDFDGDPSNLEIAVATGRSLTIFNKKGEILAGSVTRDCSSLVTGVTSFDFNGDGRPEIIYGDEQYMRIYEMDGTKELKVIWSTINPSGTLYEYPVVADVDGSGEAKLVVAANNMWVSNSDSYSTDEEKAAAADITGIRVFGPKIKKAWMPTRPVWNQYAYFAANVQDDLIPTSTSIFSGFAGNSFKRNVQEGMFQGMCRDQ